MTRLSGPLLRAGFLAAASVAPGVLRAQAGPLGEPATDRAPRLSLSLAGGLTSDATLGVSRQVAGHGLLAVGYAPRRSPVEVRADVMYVTFQDPVGQVSLNASGVLPVARVGVRGGVIRPYLLAGAGAYGLGASLPRTLSGHVGAGLRVEHSGYGAFGELRRHAAYRQTFLSLGASLRR